MGIIQCACFWLILFTIVLISGAIVVVCQGQWGAQPMGMTAAMNYFLLPDGSST